MSLSVNPAILTLYQPSCCVHMLTCFTPYVAAIVGTSLSQGRLLPDNQKHAIILPLLENPDGFSRHGQLSSGIESAFLSKVIERVVTRQANAYLTDHDLLPRCQSAYTCRRHHSTENPKRPCCTSSQTLWELLIIVSWRCLPCSICLQSLTVCNHSILLQRLQQNCGLIGAVLQWLTSFLSGRTQQMIYDGRLSAIQRMWYGVPQGVCSRLFALHHLYRWS